jgi:molybdopterin synthase sulfur carrier subunit
MAVYPQSCIATPSVGNSIDTAALQQKERRKTLLFSSIRSFTIVELITVRVKTILHFKRIIGSAEVALSLPEASTLEDLLVMMVKRWGKKLSSRLFESNSSRPLPHIRLMVNGRDIAFLNRLETELHDGDEVVILPPVAGG